jgi:hypothetical protein
MYEGLIKFYFSKNKYLKNSVKYRNYIYLAQDFTQVSTRSTAVFCSFFIYLCFSTHRP